MARFSKQPIQKDNYHSHIFNICRNRITEIDIKSDDIKNVMSALTEGSKILEQREFLVIESYNAYIDAQQHKKPDKAKEARRVINEALNGTIAALENYYESKNSFNLVKFLKQTYKDVRSYQNKLKKAQLKLAKKLQINNTSDTQFLPMVEHTVQKAFLTYYEIVSSIVEDINNMPGWKEISDFYKRKYRESLNPSYISRNRPLTFLSYAFKDNIYALFLFDLFEKNDGFLYVDSLFGTDFGKDGSKIKNALSPWIDHASQILFLHSIHSDRVRKGLSSWCSWELGEAYKSSNDKPKGFFKVVVAGIRKEDTHPIIDHQFKELDKVVHGIIIPK